MATSNVKTVADPIDAYEKIKGLWQKSRAVCNGERFVKDFDRNIDTLNFNNLLIPFSPSMTPQQYKFYKAEAELPGITAQFAKMLIGGLLRKQPVLSLSDSISADVKDWILEEFSQDNLPITSFLDQALWEEMATSRAWIYVDYPKIENPDIYTKSELLEFKPYPILWQAEDVINWRTRLNNYGKEVLDRIIYRKFEKRYDENEFHPDFVETLYVHELDELGYYQIRIYQKATEKDTNIVGKGKQSDYILIDVNTNILFNGERLGFIPVWPLNGSIDPIEPILMPIIDKEIALYNKMSRRNHLLYGASTYTPVISSDITDDEFDEIVNSGLGTWIKLRQGDTASVLETPTAALQDMDRAISSAIEEMARMGIRMLTPETAQSGVALEIRNAAQTAQLGTLNNKISNILTQIITFMINWRYDLELKNSDVMFSLTADFNPVPLGADWLRLITEWYQQGLIPRSIWLNILKHNDIIEPDYNDEEGQQEILEDEAVNFQKQMNMNYAVQMQQNSLENEVNKENQD